MTGFQKAIKYLGIILASLLALTIISAILGLIGGIFLYDGIEILDEMRNVEISQNITAVNIKVNAASIKIIEGESFSLSTNLDKLNITSSDSRLYIEQPQKRVSVHSDKVGLIILTVPADAKFDRFELKAGAGEVYIDRLEAEKLNLHFGAGEINILSLVATQSADIEAGAGELNIEGGSVCNLDLDLGVGETNITSALTGECEINCGVGETNITVIGNIGDYTIRLNKGIGSASIDGLKTNGNTNLGNGKNKIDIDGGIGAIDIRFE